MFLTGLLSVIVLGSIAFADSRCPRAKEVSWDIFVAFNMWCIDSGVKHVTLGECLHICAKQSACQGVILRKQDLENPGCDVCSNTTAALEVPTKDPKNLSKFYLYGKDNSNFNYLLSAALSNCKLKYTIDLF